jgi:hypothetical protein
MKEISQSNVLGARIVIVTSSALATWSALAAWNSRQWLLSHQIPKNNLDLEKHKNLRNPATSKNSTNLGNLATLKRQMATSYACCHLTTTRKPWPSFTMNAIPRIDHPNGVDHLNNGPN